MDKAEATSATVKQIALWHARLLAAVAFVALMATNRDYAMVWDEGHTVRRERALAHWFAVLTQGPNGYTEAFGPAVLSQGWPFGREEPDGHPPFYALLGLAGWILCKAWVPPLLAYRIGPMALAAFTVGAVYHHLARRRGALAGLTGACSILLIPQAFSMAHYAHYDVPLSCLWLLAQMSFLNSLKSRRWVVLFGVALGLAVGTKFTGIFAVVPAVAWVAWTEWIRRVPLYPSAQLRRDDSGRPATWRLLAGIGIAIVTLYAIQPGWWFEPIGGPIRFVASNMTRNDTIPIPSHFLGGFYRFNLPWYNTIVYTLVCVPVGILALGLSGIVAVIFGRCSDRGEGWLWVLSWGTLMVVRALPFAPGHDGIRLFLPSILSLAVLAGLGTAALRDRLNKTRLARLPVVLSGLALGSSLFGIVQLYPYTLSYFSEAIGGLKGAERLGFDRTYYWDTMGRELFGWINHERKNGPVALRFPAILVNIAYLREWGDLPADVAVSGVDPKAPLSTYYVVQRRPSVFNAHDWWLEKNGHPLFVIRRQGVDLLRVYSFEESARAVQETIHLPQPAHLVN